jgi:hypothetical protein
VVFPPNVTTDDTLGIHSIQLLFISSTCPQTLEIL